MTSELVEVNGGKARLNLHAGQARAWDSTRRFVFMVAGTQSGKTSYGPWHLHKMIQDAGPGDYLAVTATYDLLKLKMLPEMQRVFCQWLNWGSYHATDRVIKSHDGKSRIIIRSADAEGGLESATAKAAWLDECGQDKFDLAAWEAIQRRLSLSQGRVLGTTTPYNQGWLKTQVYDRWAAGDTDYDVIQFASLANPFFPPAEYERAERTLPDWKFQMFYRGQFSRPAGLIFDVFNPGIHVIRARPIPDTWPRIVGIDPVGERTAALWLAWDEDKEQLHAYREYYQGFGRTTGEHAQAILREGYKERVIGYAGGGPSERQARADWAAAGLAMHEPAITDVWAGIDRIYGLFKTYALVVHDSCPHLIDELGRYSRKLDRNGEPTADIADKDSYHMIDSARYACVWLTEMAGMTRQVVDVTRKVGAY
jgi:hypothetical protein